MAKSDLDFLITLFKDQNGTLIFICGGSGVGGAGVGVLGSSSSKTSGTVFQSHNILVT